MNSMSPLRTLALTIVTATGLYLSLAASSTAFADSRPFWEADDARPNVTGHVRRSGSKSHAHASREAGYATDDDRPARRRHKPTRVASLGQTDDVAPRHHHSVTGGGVTWTASSSCLNGTLASIIDDVGSSYGLSLIHI